MRYTTRVFALLLLALSLAASTGRGAAAAPTAVCTLTNPAYSGSCVVRESIPAGKSASAVCGKVLECLNDTSCSKSYCNATEVRGGWVLESAAAEK
jgi:hypothetical protein